MVNKKNIKGCLLLFILASILIFIIWNGARKNSEYDKQIQKKLIFLNNVQETIDFFNMNYLDRYVSYKEKHPDLNDEQIIIYVNAGLDFPFYTNIVFSPYLNSVYMIANKHYALQMNYVPNNLVPLDSKYNIGKNNQLVKEAKEAFENLCQAAERQGYHIRGISGYRSYDYQRKLYDEYVAQDGVEKADTYSSRPGHSDHQTGFAIDVSNESVPYTSFENTKEFYWMQNNAYLYGFILRFPKGKEYITGYQYESWHYRYVGIDIATYIQESQITFEEYYEMFIANKK